MEEERMKMFGPPNVALVAKGNRFKGNKSSQGRHTIKGSRPLRKVGQRFGLSRTKRLKAIKRKI